MLTPTLEFRDRDLARNIKNLNSQVDGYIHATMEYQSGNVVRYAKTNARWVDRTGNARNGLSTEVEWVPMVSHAIRLFHRMWYGIFLEVRWAGKYAIILPTIERYGPDTMRLLSKLFSKLRRGGVVP